MTDKEKSKESNCPTVVLWDCPTDKLTWQDYVKFTFDILLIVAAIGASLQIVSLKHRVAVKELRSLQADGFDCEMAGYTTIQCDDFPPNNKIDDRQWKINETDQNFTLKEMSF